MTDNAIETITLTRAQMNAVLKAAYPLATDDERETVLKSAMLSPSTPPIAGGGKAHELLSLIPDEIDIPPMTDRGVAGQVLDVAWPLCGGNHQDADFWNIFSFAVHLTLRVSSPGKDGGTAGVLSFADGIRAAAALFETAPDEPVDDITKLTREAQRQSILSLLKPGGQEVEAVKYEARICKGIPSDCCDYGVVNLEEGIEVCRVWKEDDVRLITDLLNGTVWPEPTQDGDDLTECFRHHVRTAIGWQAFGARPGPEMQMYEEGFKAGYRRCQSDNEPEFGEEEDYLDARARKVVGRLRDSLKAGGVEQIDIDNAVDLIVDQAKALTRPQPASTALVEAAKGLKRIVEEIDGAMNHGTWRDDQGNRLKDTPEWVALYNALGEASK